jgi:hypothetical protein
VTRLEPSRPGDFALVLGIDHYPEYRCLQGSCADALDFEAWLVEDPRGGGLVPDHCQTILSPSFPFCPTKRHATTDSRSPFHHEVNSACQRIYQAKQQFGRGGRLYFFFSGHGIGVDPIEVALCLGQWSENFFRTTALAVELYLKEFLNWGLFDEIICFLDCCRVRVVNAPGLPPGFRLPAPGSRPGRTQYLIGYATEYLDEAHEAAAEIQSPGSIDANVRGHFTRALLEGLRGGAARDQGGVPVSRLKTYLAYRTPSIARLANHSQSARVMGDYSDFEGQEPVLGSATPIAPVRFHIAGERRGPIILEGPNAEAAYTWPAPPANRPILTLRPGKHALVDGLGHEVVFFAAPDPKGEPQDVEF